MPVVETVHSEQDVVTQMFHFPITTQTDDSRNECPAVPVPLPTLSLDVVQSALAYLPIVLQKIKPEIHGCHFPTRRTVQPVTVQWQGFAVLHPAKTHEKQCHSGHLEWTIHVKKEYASGNDRT